MVVREPTLEFRWLAGWLEGEGCFQSKCRVGAKNGPYFYAEIMAGSCDIDILERVKKYAGGAIYPDRSPSRLKRGGKPFWRWVLSCDAESRSLMETLLPLMGQRRQQQIRLCLSRRKGRQ